MSHTKYTTEAIVLSGVDTGEADKYIRFLTKDFGLVGVHARGLRKVYSKQRTFLQSLSLARVSLIKGRNIWRLAHVEASKETTGFADTLEKRNISARVFRVLLRFIRGEEASPNLFDTVRSGLEFVNGNMGENKEKIHIAEALIMLRIFYILGYVAPTEKIDALLHDTAEYNDMVLNLAMENAEEVEAHIYNAIEESGL